MDWKVIKIGGSLLAPTDIAFNFPYAQNLRKVLDTLNFNFSLTAGGGVLTRTYQQLARDYGISIDQDLHKIGIITSSVNNEMLRTVFADRAFERVIRYKEFDEYITGKIQLDFNKNKYVVVSASKPGKSNDWNALQMAKRLGSQVVINLKDIDGVYSADPKKDPHATLQPRITWDEYFDIIGNPSEFEPGGNFPVDIFAAREAYSLGISFMVLTGKDLENVGRAVRGEEFEGTLIQG